MGFHAGNPGITSLTLSAKAHVEMRGFSACRTAGFTVAMMARALNAFLHFLPTKPYGVTAMLQIQLKSSFH